MQTVSCHPFILYACTMLISSSTLETLHHSIGGSREKLFTPEFEREEACISLQYCVGCGWGCLALNNVL